MSETRCYYGEGNNVNSFDFSSSEYSSNEITEFFSLATFPQDIAFVVDPLDRKLSYGSTPICYHLSYYEFILLAIDKFLLLDKKRDITKPVCVHQRYRISYFISKNWYIISKLYNTRTRPTAMEKMTTTKECPNWEQFLFYHKEKSQYKVLLPTDSETQILYLSSHTIFCLRKGGFSLLANTRSNYEEKNSINTFDFSSCEYSSQQVIEFFFLVTFPQDVQYIVEP